MSGIKERFSRWLEGDNTTFDHTMESIPKKKVKESRATIRARMADHRMIREQVYDLENNRVVKSMHVAYMIMAVILGIFIMVNLLICVSYLPPVGANDNPTSNEVAQRYIESGLKETGAVNIVTGMILDYRAFDTFGESNVLFIATITVLILLKNNKKKIEADIEEPENDRLLEPKNDVILQKVATFLVPILVLFGIYVILNGHLSPGGGFSGGAIIGAGLILYLSAFGFKSTERFFTEKTYKIICFVALTFYCLAKSYSFFTGANELESHIPLGEAGAIISSGLILPLNICVGLVVACTMYTFYVMFRKGDF